MRRHCNITLISMILGVMPLMASADSTQAKRIAKANYEYCVQESLSNENYCGCIADVYATNLVDTPLSKAEENLMVEGLSGQLDFDSLDESDILLADSLAEKLDNPMLEEGFAACSALLEDPLDEEVETTEEEDGPLSEAQLRAIEELEAIEEMEDLEELDDLED